MHMIKIPKSMLKCLCRVTVNHPHSTHQVQILPYLLIADYGGFLKP
jgi:hypothetical protein